ncbi:MAG: response regulator [Verrucomicrobia bacterium]|nr:response regulator [Verrucomicrobiota bacterium]
MDDERSRPLEVLLVEDDPGDVRLTREALNARTHLHVAENAEEAMAFLQRKGEHQDAARPDLILLDLNLPGRDGRELLAEIKSSEKLRHIPVVVLTTSDDDKDIQRAYDLNASSYVTKPVNWVKFVGIVRAIESFWQNAARMPRE